MEIYFNKQEFDNDMNKSQKHKYAKFKAVTKWVHCMIFLYEFLYRTI